MSKLKKRQHLPLFAKLNYKVDIERLRDEFFQNGFDDWNKYNGLKSDFASENGRIVRRILLGHFLSEEERQEREAQEITEGGEAYKMLCLTDYDESKAPRSFDAEKIAEQNPELLRKANMLERIHDPNHPLYVPEADERNYTKPTEYLKGYTREIYDMFKGQVTRSRYAVLMPGEKIDPHRDLNTNYGIRIHVPVITNPDVIIGCKGKKRSVEMNMPANGSVWFVNAAYEHWVYNNSNEPRVHLVFSVVGQEDLENPLQEWWDIAETEAANG